MEHTPRHREESTTRMKRLSLLLLPLVALLALAVVAVPGFSSATFTSSTAPSVGTVTAADDWTAPMVAVQALPAAVRGTVTVTATATDADSGVQDVTIQRRADGASGWTTICSDTTAPYSCSWVTTSAPNGAHDLRAVATDRAGNTATSAVVRTLVDNQTPTVTMTDPGTPLSGTRTFSATAADAHSGVAQVAIQASPNGSTWTTLCTATSSPFACSYDTRQLAGGTYSFRAVATDRAGNTATSAPVTGRVVDNAVATVTLADPGAYLAGTVNLTATGTSTAGIASIAIQRTPAGGSSWTTICTDTTSPYACSWSTTGVADGLYDLRAVLTDSQGKVTTSAVVSNRRVDNRPLTAVDVQTVNGGTAGRPDTGDQVVYTFSKEVNLGTVKAGWDGTSTPVTAELRAGLFSNNSSLEILEAQLGTINLGVRYNGLLSNTTQFAASMTASVVTVNGLPRTVVVVQLGDRTVGGQPTGGRAVDMVWTPSTAVTDPGGRASSGAAATESGALDTDF